jgi:hypothetical protein
MSKAFKKYLGYKIDLSQNKLELIRSVTVEMVSRNLMRPTLKHPCHTLPRYPYERPASCEGAKDKIKRSFRALFPLTRLEVPSYVADAMQAELAAILVFEPERGAAT